MRWVAGRRSRVSVKVSECERGNGAEDLTGGMNALEVFGLKETALVCHVVALVCRVVALVCRVGALVCRVV